MTSKTILNRQLFDEYRISSWIYARALGLIIIIAFGSIAVQAQGLFGAHGIVPIGEFVAAAKNAHYSFWDCPSLLWIFTSDLALQLTWALGLVAGALVIFGILPRLGLLIAWIAYLSIVNIGQPFTSFQWDGLLLEAVLASIFFVPGGLRDRFATHAAPQRWARFALWWLIVRLMFRSAYVKIASDDPTWAQFTALTYHYWTQPLPTIIAWYANQLPLWLQKLSCVVLFAIEGGTALLILIPHRWARRSAAVLIIGLMTLIALTGNYGFFNLLTIVLCIPLLDDALLLRCTRFAPLASPKPTTAWQYHFSNWGGVLIISLASTVFVAGFSDHLRNPLPVFVDSLNSFNNYGLFAVMTTTRPEIVIEGSDDGQNWKEYQFKYKPGDLRRAPVWTAPHQPRLDWQMWFAALGNYRHNAWVWYLMQRLNSGEPSVLALLQENPFPDHPPQFVRALRYEYSFTNFEERRKTGNWWKREFVGPYAPTVH